MRKHRSNRIAYTFPASDTGRSALSQTQRHKRRPCYFAHSPQVIGIHP